MAKHGNKVFLAQDRVTGTPYRLETKDGVWYTNVQATAFSERTAYYYDADDRLRVVDRRGCLTFHPNFKPPVCDPDHPPAYEKRGAFEEYRYDALGRRVLVRTRQEFVCTSQCLHQLRRMVWDGDQMLYEIAAPGGSAVAAADMEKDTGLATPFATAGYFFPTGRVEYVHGHGIDQPLRFYREEYSDSIPAASFIPQANWRGVYDMGVRSGGCYFRYWSLHPATPQEERQIGVDTTSYSPGGASGTETLCADVSWPAQHTWAYHQYRRGYHGPYNWMGSLAFGMRDASGLHYRRNRFYDAEQGRFTQEDPIGLAGGINLYGYANGDPVSYSDPYGLRADSVYVVGSPEYVSRVTNSLIWRARNSPTFAKAYNAVAGFATKHIWYTEEGASSCPDRKACTRPAGLHAARISHALNPTDYFTNYVFGAWGIGDGTRTAHEFAHAAALLLDEAQTGVSRDCASRSRSVREPCAIVFEEAVNNEVKGKEPRNPQEAVPPNDD